MIYDSKEVMSSRKSLDHCVPNVNVIMTMLELSHVFNCDSCV